MMERKRLSRIDETSLHQHLPISRESMGLGHPNATRAVRYDADALGAAYGLRYTGKIKHAFRKPRSTALAQPCEMSAKVTVHGVKTKVGTVCVEITADKAAGLNIDFSICVSRIPPS